MFKGNTELWVEKYRPKSIDEMILDKQQIDFFEKCIKNEEIPHILLTGPPGSGKTSIARILIDCLIHDESDVLICNGSNDNSIEYVRGTISGFIKSPPLASKRKIIFIDEFDFYSFNAQGALRNLFENCDASFLLTGNYISKIMDALISRTQSFIFDRIGEEYCYDYCKKILDSEKVEFNENDVKSVIRALHPDVRKIVGVLQRNSSDGKLRHIDSDSLMASEKKIVGYILEICDHIGQSDESTIVNKNVTIIQNLLSSGREPDFRMMYQMMFTSKMPPWGKIKINSYANGHMNCAIPAIHFEALVLDIIVAGKNYRAAFNAKK